MFENRINICRIAGINIGIDISWLVIALLLSWTLAVGFFPAYYPNHTIENYWFMGVLGMLGVFVCILLHEFGHALVAKHYGLPISQITLFIFGGIAEIKKETENPKVDLLVSVAGPIVSVLLAIIMYALTSMGKTYAWPEMLPEITGYLAMVNVMIVLFNLIPAFPLDGGRILRALLWWKTNNLSWATKIASQCGIGFGLILIFFGFYILITSDIISGIWFMIIGFFLRNAAQRTETHYLFVNVLRKEKVAKFMTKNPITVPPHITIQELIDQYTYVSHHHLYPVTDNEKLLGYISLEEMKSIPSQDWSKTKVLDATVPLTPAFTIPLEATGVEALTRMQQGHIPTLLVVHDGKLCGILTYQDLLKLITLKLELTGG